MRKEDFQDSIDDSMSLLGELLEMDAYVVGSELESSYDGAGLKLTIEITLLPRRRQQ